MVAEFDQVISIGGFSSTMFSNIHSLELFHLI